jgi:hypothetical protein
LSIESVSGTLVSLFRGANTGPRKRSFGGENTYALPPISINSGRNEVDVGRFELAVPQELRFDRHSDPIQRCSLRI